MFDGKVEHTGHFAVVGEFKAGPSRLPNQHFVEKKLVLLLDINAFRIAELFRGEVTAVWAKVMLLKNRGHI